MQAITRERTHQFPKNQPIDCRLWLEFTIVEETYRYHRIRFTTLDTEAGACVKCSERDEPAEN